MPKVGSSWWSCGLTFHMSGGRKWAKPACGRPLDGRVSLGFVANHFDVVPVRTNDESCIVVRVVVRAQTRRTIVFATRVQSRAIESFDLLAILGRERQVKMRRPLLGLVQAQRSLTLWAKLDTVRRLPL